MKNKQTNSYWLYGKHAVYSALENKNRKYSDLLITKNNVDELNAKHSNISFEIVSRDEIDTVLTNRNLVHQGIILRVLPLVEKNISQVINSDESTLVIIDQINDPQNLGAITRSCAAFDVAAVIMPKCNSVSENAVIAKAASGALELIPLIRVTNVAETINVLKKNGYWIAGLSGDGNATFDNIRDIKKLAFIFGSEGNGLRTLTRKNCDFLLSIDIHSQIESLNLSNAVAISLHERYKNLKSI